MIQLLQSSVVVVVEAASHGAVALQVSQMLHFFADSPRHRRVWEESAAVPWVGKQMAAIGRAF